MRRATASKHSRPPVSGPNDPRVSRYSPDDLYLPWSAFILLISAEVSELCFRMQSCHVCIHVCARARTSPGSQGLIVQDVFRSTKIHAAASVDLDLFPQLHACMHVRTHAHTYTHMPAFFAGGGWVSRYMICAS